MESVIVSDPGVFLGKTSERLVIRGPRPRLELIEGGPQLSLDLPLQPAPRLTVVTSNGLEPQPSTMPRRRGSANGASQEQLELPLFRISEIVITSPGVSLSTDLIEACCERGIRVAFLTSSGRPFAMLSSPMLTATVVTRREQMAAYGDARGVTFAKAVVHGKLTNQAALLKYFGKYQKTVAPKTFDDLGEAVESMVTLRRDIAKVDGPHLDDVRAPLLAIEGSAGRLYWSGVRRLLSGHAEFATREHRGADDPINAALNYGYGVLYTQVWGAVMNAGLEPFAGFLHVDRPGKPSLVLDLVEEFRQPLVDRPVIAALTKGGGFDLKGGLLTTASRQAVATAVLERLESEATFHGRRYRMKSIVQIQARNLATFLRGGAPYRAFVFKW